MKEAENNSRRITSEYSVSYPEGTGCAKHRAGNSCGMKGQSHKGGSGQCGLERSERLSRAGGACIRT